VFVGTGVDLTGIQPQHRRGTEGRIRGSISDNEGAATTEQWIGRSSRCSTN
jgi:hypothetical protein